jgi:putative colanic acid biosynthesis glycosyltransferase
MTAPAISIIIVCKNAGSRLANALESVQAQREAAVELIVVDGGSTDGTTELIAAKRAHITTLISEPDRGIYDAMNKGIAAAKGDWVLFLGADDRLVGDRILSEVIHWARKTESGVIGGEAAYDDGRIYQLRRRFRPIFRNFVHHQSTFYRRSLFEENGHFDAKLRIMGDYDFNLRLWKNRVRFKPIPLRISACASRGTSDSGCWLVYREEIAVRHRYFPAWRCWAWDVMSVVRFLAKRLKRLGRR